MSLEDAVIEEPLEEPHVSQLASVFQSLVGNGMGVIPTDTQHAYVTPVSSKSGVRRIYDIKGVAADQPPAENRIFDVRFFSDSYVIWCVVGRFIEFAGGNHSVCCAQTCRWLRNTAMWRRFLANGFRT